MSWNVYSGLPADARWGLDEFSHLSFPTGQAVIEGLDYCDADNVGAYVQRAIDEGLRLSPDEACEILEYYWPEGYRSVLPVVDTALSTRQALDVLDYAVDPDDTVKTIRYLAMKGTRYDAAAIAELEEYFGEEEALAARESMLPELPGRSTSDAPAERTKDSGQERFTFEQAFDYCDVHMRIGMDKAAIAQLMDDVLANTDCTDEEREELAMAFGVMDLPDPR